MAGGKPNADQKALMENCIAIVEGVMDAIKPGANVHDVAKIGDFESALLGYMRAECSEVMQQIEVDGDWNDEREAAFKSAIETFKTTQTW